ncbi:EF-hand domain-containing protein [Pelagibius sp. CAU 1746]|uniref:EF-hand domain-containing protein n=1 Tax=Pelagibius sp. CAU 1746 TaxID=3140370 RepID=UPI00325B3829
MQKIILGILAIAAVAGWAAAYVFFADSGELADRLADAEAARAEAASAVEAARSDLAKQAAAAGSLAAAEKKLGAAQADILVLEKQVGDKRSELAEVAGEIESRKLELRKVERQLIEKRTSLETATQDAELAGHEVERLRAESAELMQTAERLRKDAPGAAGSGPAAAPSTATSSTATSSTPMSSTGATAGLAAQPRTSEPQTMDQKSRIERMFKLLDKNGDGEIDEFEFRLNSIRLLGAIDTNDDGVVTPDETLLPPERFSLFDKDGDGKIASLEFVEAFRILDRDSKGAITLEDYQAFIDSAAK